MIYVYTFSPTGGTQKIAQAVAKGYGDAPVTTIDFTSYEVRMKDEKPIAQIFTADDVVLVAVPVYAGRVPNILLSYLKSFYGNNAKAIALLSYGNRHFDDALVELVDLLTASGFEVIAAGAFIAQHAFAKTLAEGRPDSADLLEAEDFGKAIKAAQTLSTETAQAISSETAQTLSIEKSNVVSEVSRSDSQSNWLLCLPGERPYRPYYQPLSAEGRSYDFKRIIPVTLESCIDCGRCVTLCPVPGICIKCQACIQNCPAEARAFTDEDFIHHKADLETQYKNVRLKNSTWIGPNH